MPEIDQSAHSGPRSRNAICFLDSRIIITNSYDVIIVLRIIFMIFWIDVSSKSMSSLLISFERRWSCEMHFCIFKSRLHIFHGKFYSYRIIMVWSLVSLKPLVIVLHHLILIQAFFLDLFISTTNLHPYSLSLSAVTLITMRILWWHPLLQHCGRYIQWTSSIEESTRRCWVICHLFLL